MPSPAERPALAFIGGTGPEGRGLATRFAAAGYPVIIGSRSAERAQQAATELGSLVPQANFRGAENAEAAANAQISVLTVPFSGIDAAAEAIASAARAKIVVSAIAPIEWRDGKPHALRPEAGSAAQEVKARLPESRIASAFQTVDAHELMDLARTLDTDVLVCSDDAEARHAVMDLVRAIPGFRALSGGRLPNSRHVEEITSLLIALNRIYKVHSGIRITGVER